MSSKIANIAFSHFHGVGPVRYQKLVVHFGNAQDAYNASEDNLREVIGKNIGQEFVKFRETYSLDYFYNLLSNYQSKNISVITQYDCQYPKKLKKISNPPVCLYAKGNLNLLSEKSFAIVGTRKTSEYGINTTKNLASAIAKRFVIVSGMAEGIDKFAHESALKINKSTIAVLGCGVDVIYPYKNKDLYEKILKNNSLIVSELYPGAKPKAGHFLTRNRIISALSEGVLVIEGAKDSGAINTGKHAREQGIRLFALPGAINTQQSEGTNLLIKQGATLVSSVNDIFQEYGIESANVISDYSSDSVIVNKIKDMNLSALESELINLISSGSLLADEISNLSERPINQILPILSNLEINGLIEKRIDGKYEVLPF